MYFLGLSFRNTVGSLYFLKIIKISHVSIWKWIQKYKIQNKVSGGNKKIQEYVIDETAIKVGSELIWLWAVVR